MQKVDVTKIFTREMPLLPQLEDPIRRSIFAAIVTRLRGTGVELASDSDETKLELFVMRQNTVAEAKAILKRVISELKRDHVYRSDLAAA